MSEVYDNWERLVEATLKREQYRELALADSRQTSFSSSASTRFASRFHFKFQSPNSYKKEYYAERILAADHLIKAADAATVFRQHCMELKSKVRELGSLLRQAERASDTLYDRPTRRIMDDTEQVLQKASKLILKCRGGMRRVFTAIPSTAFPSLISQLEHSILNLSWLLHEVDEGDEYYNLGVPPIAVDEPILCHIWEIIAVLHTGLIEDRCEAAASLVSLAREDVHYRELIVEEGGIPPLLQLLNEGNPEGQEAAATAIGLLASHQLFGDEIADVFNTILRKGTSGVQAVVAWAISEFAENDSVEQYLLEKHYIIELLTRHLIFSNEERNHLMLLDASVGTLESDEDIASIEHLMAMAARALYHLAKGDSAICQKIARSKALPRFVVILENVGLKEIQYYCVMTFMAITAEAELDFDFKCSLFRDNSAVGKAIKAIIYELFRLIEAEDPKLIAPCVKTIGNLARTLRATETHMISPLVRLLDFDDDKEKPQEILDEACIALAKFASNDNYLRVEYSNVIIDAGGIKNLITLVYFGEQTVQIPALLLLCHIARNVVHRKELVNTEVLQVLEWATKQAFFISKDPELEYLLRGAMEGLKLHQREVDLRQSKEYN